MTEYDKELSLQYHSIRIYDGVYSYKNVAYRIGDNRMTVRDETEHYYDTWIDFHLIPTERPSVALPSANQKLITIPGRVTPIDMTTYLTGHETFGNRTGSWTFYTDNDFVEKGGGWVKFDKTIRSLFHGRIVKISLRDDPNYFYVGKITMGQWQPGDARSSVTFNYNFYSYKKSFTCSMDRWHFDDFDFRDGVIMYLKDLEVENSRIVYIFGSPERISPHISGTRGLLVDKLENNNWISYGAVPWFEIESPHAVVPRLVIDEGVTQLRFRGNGTVTIDYRRGLL